MFVKQRQKPDELSFGSPVRSLTQVRNKYEGPNVYPGHPLYT